MFIDNLKLSDPNDYSVWKRETEALIKEIEPWWHLWTNARKKKIRRLIGLNIVASQYYEHAATRVEKIEELQSLLEKSDEVIGRKLGWISDKKMEAIKNA